VRLAALTLAFLALGTAPGLAANRDVAATEGSEFSPAKVVIRPGDSVTWRNAGGIHNVRFDDGSFDEPDEPSATPWTAMRTFGQEGSFRYFCELHGGPGLVGMSGTVVVTTDTTAPSISRFSVEPGDRIRFRLSEQATVSGRIRKAGSRRTVKRLRLGTRRGSVSVRFSGRGLDPGLYRLLLTATDAAGNGSKTFTRSFRIEG
jgi:plastocyanin